MELAIDLISNESRIRLVFFIGVFVLIASWEVFLPRRQVGLNKIRRWINNLALAGFNTLLLRFLIPFSVLSASYYVQELGVGILPSLELSFGMEIVIFLVLMDLIIYGQHRLFHRAPILWKAHRVHHSDIEFDVSTGVRFHPLEIGFSFLIKIGAIFLLGPPLVAVIIFDIVLNASSMFNHGNLILSRRLDRYLRLFLVTPDMHRVHHSTHTNFSNANFGFNLPWWDYIFGSYVAQPPIKHQSMLIGLTDFREIKYHKSLLEILKLPFLKNQDPYIAGNNKQ